MSTDSHDWDRDEREALAGLDDQVAAMRDRHRADPPLELLRAGHAGVLPPELQASIGRHLSARALSRTLVEGLEQGGGALEIEDQQRLFARIMTEAGKADTAARSWRWLRPVFLGSAVAALASIAWFVSSRSEVAAPTAPPESTVAVAQPPSVPSFLLPLDKPEVRLSMAALTWRGSTGDNQLLADLKPGLDAYRRSDYAEADRELTAVAGRYPGTIEVLFYQGVSRLFLKDVPGAMTSLAAAEDVGDRAFATDVSWYRAVADERAGNIVGARARVEALCRASGEGAARACAALNQLGDASTPR